MHLTIAINVHSITDVVTNSSSEIFCQISANPEIIESIVSYLNTNFKHGKFIEANDYYGEGEKIYIDFWCEMGAFTDYGYIPELFAEMLDKLLAPIFGKENYKIETDIPL